MNLLLFYVLGAILIFLDTLSKIVSGYFLENPIILIPHFLSLEYVQNPGIAFSLPLTGIALKIITCILIFGIFWYYKTNERDKKNFWIDLGYIFIFSGALWNAWERLFRGYVTDMISIEHFAVCNLADSYISIWAFILVFLYWRHS